MGSVHGLSMKERREIVRSRETKEIGEMAEYFKKKEIEKIKTEIKECLNGIDQDECDTNDGWWETSKGAEFGAKKLKEVMDIIEKHLQ